MYLGASWTVSPERGRGGVTVSTAASEEGIIIITDGVSDAVDIASTAAVFVMRRWCGCCMVLGLQQVPAEVGDVGTRTPFVVTGTLVVENYVVVGETGGGSA